MSAADRRRAADSSRLLVAGFHGTVAPGRTPAIRQPVLEDEKGRRARVEGDRVQVLTTKHEPMPPTGTELPAKVRWRPGTDCVVLGAHDVDAIVMSGAREATRVASLVAWLRSPRVVDPNLGACSLPEGGHVLLLCSLDEQAVVLRPVRDAAHAALKEAVARSDADAIYQQAFWLQRACHWNEEDLFTVAAALEMAGYRQHSAQLLDGFRLTRLPEWEARLGRARGALRPQQSVHRRAMLVRRSGLVEDRRQVA